MRREKQLLPAAEGLQAGLVWKWKLVLANIMGLILTWRVNPLSLPENKYTGCPRTTEVSLKGLLVVPMLRMLPEPSPHSASFVFCLFVFHASA